MTTSCSQSLQQEAVKGALWQQEALEQRGEQESCYAQTCRPSRASPRQAAPPRAAYLVVLLKQPLQELVAQMVELRRAAGGKAEPVGRDPSEPPQALNEGQHASGSSAKSDLTQNTQLHTPSLLKSSGCLQACLSLDTAPLVLGRSPRGCTVASPRHIHAAQAAREMT